LRDPLDIRISWFRHCRRIHRHTAKDPTEFDRVYSTNANAFAHVSLATFGMDVNASELHYENFVLEVCQAAAANPTNLLIVFYEELLKKPHRLVERLAEFTRWGRDDLDLIDTISAALTRDACHPIAGHRQGSSGAGHLDFDEESMCFIDDFWDSFIRSSFPAYRSYEVMFETCTALTYPLLIGGLKARERPLDVKLEKRSGVKNIIKTAVKEKMEDFERLKDVIEQDASLATQGVLKTASSFTNLMGVRTSNLGTRSSNLGEGGQGGGDMGPRKSSMTSFFGFGGSGPKTPALINENPDASGQTGGYSKRPSDIQLKLPRKLRPGEIDPDDD